MLYFLTAIYPKSREAQKWRKISIRSAVTTAVALAFCFFSLSVLLSRSAQAADPIITGTLNCNGKLKQLPNGFTGCTQQIPVRHLGKGGPSSGNPNDYGTSRKAWANK